MRPLLQGDGVVLGPYAGPYLFVTLFEVYNMNLLIQEGEVASPCLKLRKR